MEARIVGNAIKLNYCVILNGEYVAETDCHNFDEYRLLPNVIDFNGRLMGKTGWNSDSEKACYKTRCLFAWAK